MAQESGSCAPRRGLPFSDQRGGIMPQVREDSISTGFRPMMKMTLSGSDSLRTAFGSGRGMTVETGRVGYIQVIPADRAFNIGGIRLACDLENR